MYWIRGGGLTQRVGAHYNIQDSSSNGGSVSVKLVRHFPSELSNIEIEKNFLRDIQSKQKPAEILWINSIVKIGT